MTEYLEFGGQRYRIRQALYSAPDFTVYELIDAIMLNGPVQFLAVTTDQRLYSIDVFEGNDENVLLKDYGYASVVVVC